MVAFKHDKECLSWPRSGRQRLIISMSRLQRWTTSNTLLVATEHAPLVTILAFSAIADFPTQRRVGSPSLFVLCLPIHSLDMPRA